MDFGLEVRGAGHWLLCLGQPVLLLEIDNAAIECCQMAAVGLDDSLRQSFGHDYSRLAEGCSKQLQRPGHAAAAHQLTQVTDSVGLVVQLHPVISTTHSPSSSTS